MSEMLGAYRIVRKLGEGGMAVAYLGTAPDERPVVLKMPLLPSTETSVKLRDEAQAGFRIQCPFVVRTLDFFVDRGRPVLVVEYVDGCALRDLRQRGPAKNPLPAVAVAWIGRAIAEGLAAIHEATDEQGHALGMLHRDVTASNILIDQLGVPRLIDLGIARSDENQQEKTQTGMIKGTLRFVAPELLLGADYTAATDLWALGVSLFEAAVGRQMVSGPPVEVFRALTQGKHTALRPGEFIEPALSDALHALLCEKDARLRNARAAARMFAIVEQKLAHADPARRTGQVWLAASVPHASPNEDDTDAVLPAVVDDGFDADALGTLLVPGPARAAEPPNATRIVIGDTTSGSAPTFQALPAVEVNLGDDEAPPAAVPARGDDDGRLSTLLLARLELADAEAPASMTSSAAPTVPEPLAPASNVATPHVPHVPHTPLAVARPLAAPTTAAPTPATLPARVDDVFAPLGLAHLPTLQLRRIDAPLPDHAAPTLQLPPVDAPLPDHAAPTLQLPAVRSAADACDEAPAPVPDPAAVAAEARRLGPPAVALARGDVDVARAAFAMTPTVRMPAATPAAAPAFAPSSATAPPTLQMRAVAAVTPASAAAPAFAPSSATAPPTLQMPAVAVAPGPAAAFAAAPTLVVDIAAAAAQARAAGASAGGGVRAPRLPQLHLATGPAAPGDVLPAGAATLVMPAWTPPVRADDARPSSTPTTDTPPTPTPPTPPDDERG
jgi:serine/threonine protein kinase